MMSYILVEVEELVEAAELSLLWSNELVFSRGGVHQKMFHICVGCERESVCVRKRVSE